MRVEIEILGDAEEVELKEATIEKDVLVKKIEMYKEKELKKM